MATVKVPILDPVTGLMPASKISGLGNSATRNVGAVAGTVAAGDDSRIVGAAQVTGVELTDLDARLDLVENKLAVPQKYGTIQSTGTTIVQQPILDFEGGGVVIVDDPANTRTKVTIGGAQYANPRLTAPFILPAGTTALTNITGMGFTVNATEKWIIEVILRVYRLGSGVNSATANQGITVKLSRPGGTTTIDGFWMGSPLLTTNTLDPPVERLAGSLTGQLFGVLGNDSTQARTVTLRGMVICGSGGTIIPQIAQTNAGYKQATITTANGSASVTAPGGTFVSGDVGSLITATGLAAGTTIATYVNGGSITVSANATAAGTVTADVAANTIVDTGSFMLATRAV